MVSQLLGLIEDWVNSPGPWKEKRDQLLQEANDEERTALLEFVSWFPDPLGE